MENNGNGPIIVYGEEATTSPPGEREELLSYALIAVILWQIFERTSGWKCWLAMVLTTIVLMNLKRVLVPVLLLETIAIVATR